MNFKTEFNRYKGFTFSIMIGIFLSVAMFISTLSFEISKEQRSFQQVSKLHFVTLVDNFKQFYHISSALYLKHKDQNFKTKENIHPLILKTCKTTSDCQLFKKDILASKGIKRSNFEDAIFNIYSGGEFAIIFKTGLVQILNTSYLKSLKRKDSDTNIQSCFSLIIDSSALDIFCDVDKALFSRSLFNFSATENLKAVSFGFHERLKPSFIPSNLYTYPFVVLLIFLTITVATSYWFYVNSKKNYWLEVQQKELEIQNTLLEKQNLEIKQFSYMAAHDLKTPLANIYSFAELLIDDYSDSLPQEGVEYVEIIEKQISKMIKMVSSLLEYGQAQNNKNFLRPISIADIFKEELNIHPQRNILDFKVQVVPNIIFFDQDKLIRIARNLIDNAIKYRKGDYNQLILHSVNDSNLFHHFIITDHGIGINKQDQEKVFAPFKRLSSQNPGVGMGLAIIQKFIESHGGKIWVESTPGINTSFHFTIPKIKFKITKQQKKVPWKS